MRWPHVRLLSCPDLLSVILSIPLVLYVLWNYTELLRVVLSYCRSVLGIPIHPPILTPKSQPDIPSHSPMDGQAGLSMGFSHVPTQGVPPNPSVPSRPIVPWMDGTVHGNVTCLILEYTPESQCPVPLHSSVGWTGLSMGLLHISCSSRPPNPSGFLCVPLSCRLTNLFRKYFMFI